MIKAGDLRTGNLVLHNGAIIIIDGIDKSNESVMVEDKHIAIPLADIDPIPLTPEWLKRCGFAKQSEGCWSRNGIVIMYDDSDAPGIVGDFRFEFAGELRIIDGLHHLQNIYLDITREELTIKETV